MPVRYIVRNGIGWVVLDRPPVNALNTDMLQGIIDTMEHLAEDDSVRVVVIKGAGEVFSGGADIREMVELDVEGARAFSKLGQVAMRAVSDVPKPVIAALNGPAIGGGTVLAAFCDLRIAATGITFALSEIDRGLYPGWDAADRFVKLLGMGRATELYLMGESFDARQALEWGFVNRVAAPGKFSREAEAYAFMLAEKSQLGLSCAKQVIQMGDGESVSEVDEEFFGTCICSVMAKQQMHDFLSRKIIYTRPGVVSEESIDKAGMMATAAPDDEHITGEGGGGSIMSAIKNIKTRCSVRKYTDEGVLEEDVNTMMECAAQAPSPANWQPWKFIVVRDRELKKKMVDVVESECNQKLSDDRLEKMRSGIERNRKYFAFFAGAPVVIVATYRPGKFLIARAAEALGASEYDAAREEGFCVPMSVGASIQNLLLAAHALGYGACWMSGPLFAKKQLEELLGVEEPWEIGAIIPVGRPDEVPEARERKLMAELVDYR